MNNHNIIPRLLILLNILSLVFIGAMVMSHDAGGYGLLIIAPLVMLTWGATIIGDLISLPFITSWLVINNKLNKSQKILGIIIFMALLMIGGYFLHSYLVKQ